MLLQSVLNSAFSFLITDIMATQCWRIACEKCMIVLPSILQVYMVRRYLVLDMESVFFVFR